MNYKTDFDPYVDILLIKKKKNFCTENIMRKNSFFKVRCEKIEKIGDARGGITDKPFQQQQQQQYLQGNWKNKLSNMKVTIMPIVIGAFGTITKGLLKGLEDLEVGGWEQTLQTTALLRTARILRRVLETWGNLLSLKLLRKTIS